MLSAQVVAGEPVCPSVTAAQDDEALAASDRAATTDATDKHLTNFPCILIAIKLPRIGRAVNSDIARAACARGVAFHAKRVQATAALALSSALARSAAR